MQTVDFHTHLLNENIKFDRLYDKIAIKLFGKKFGLNLTNVKKNPYKAYTDALINNIRKSKYIKKVALFGVDARVDENGKEIDRDKSVCASNEQVLRFYEQNKDIIIPFFSINPNRSDALELIDYYHQKGFMGAKFLQNYWGIDTRDKKYKSYFQKLKEFDLPLIIHTGSENSIQSDNKYETLEMLEAPLSQGVKTIAAHMALSYSFLHPFKLFSKNPKNFNIQYFKLLEMLKKYNNLYADISAILTFQRAKVLRHLSNQTDIHHKLLFGTDFPVPFSAVFTTYDLAWKKRLKIEKEKNPFDRYTKAILEYFQEDSAIFYNYKKLIY